MSRIESTFAALQQQGRKALIPFVTAGDPHPSITLPLLHALVAAGADVIELGVPFSDPMADGPTIQRATERALLHNVSLRNVLDMVAEFRRADANTPIVLMGYGNPIEAMGWEAFAARAAEVGVDGVLTVDFPPEESHEAFTHLEAHGLDPIFLLAPTSRLQRIEQVNQIGRGYLYYVSLRGVTGASHLDLDDVARKLAEIRQHTQLPVGVGFGVKDAETAGAIAKLADAVVVGSALIRIIEQNPDGAHDVLIRQIADLLGAMRAAMDAV